MKVLVSNAVRETADIARKLLEMYPQLAKVTVQDKMGRWAGLSIGANDGNDVTIIPGDAGIGFRGYLTDNLVEDTDLSWVITDEDGALKREYMPHPDSWSTARMAKPTKSKREIVMLAIDCLLARHKVFDQMNQESRAAEFLPPTFAMDVPVTFTRQNIADIMSTALEGSINYWCQKILLPTGAGALNGANNAAACLGLGVDIQLVVSDNDPPDDEPMMLDPDLGIKSPFTLTLPMLLEGIRKYIVMGRWHPTPEEARDDDGKRILDDNGRPVWGIDVGYLDASDADCILQLAVFGEFIFG